MFGFSVFLGEEMTIETRNYLDEMKESGFKGVFTSLHIPEEDSGMRYNRLSELGEWTQKNDLELIADISGSILTDMGLSFNRPQEILQTGLTGLRIDYGIDNRTVANLSHDMKVALNASTLHPTDIHELKRYGADFQQLEAWHNYYPRPETGLGLKEFVQRNQWLRESGLNVMAFVPGNGKLRGPLYQQLPTLEKHRGRHPLAGALELQQSCFVDKVYIGDPTINQKTKEQFQQYIQKNTLLLYAKKTQQYKKVDLVLGSHRNRLDVARDVIRSADARFKALQEIIPENTIERKKGSITIDNRLYGRYMGEIQVTKRDLPKDEKVNVAACIIQEDLDLLEWCVGGQQFDIQLSHFNEGG